MKNKTHVFGNLIEITLKVKTNFVRQKKNKIVWKHVVGKVSKQNF